MTKHDPVLEGLATQLRQKAFDHYNRKIDVINSKSEEIANAFGADVREIDSILLGVLKNSIEETVLIVAKWLIDYHLPEDVFNEDLYSRDFQEMMQTIGKILLENWKQ